MIQLKEPCDLKNKVQKIWICPLIKKNKLNYEDKIIGKTVLSGAATGHCTICLSYNDCGITMVTTPTLSVVIFFFIIWKSDRQNFVCTLFCSLVGCSRALVCYTETPSPHFLFRLPSWPFLLKGTHSWILALTFLFFVFLL